MGFEENIKSVLEDYAVPYNSADWKQLEKSLDGSSRRSNYSAGLFYGALLTLAITTAGVFWYMSDEDGNSATTQDNAAIEQVDPKSNAPSEIDAENNSSSVLSVEQDLVANGSDRSGSDYEGDQVDAIKTKGSQILSNNSELGVLSNNSDVSGSELGSKEASEKIKREDIAALKVHGFELENTNAEGISTGPNSNKTHGPIDEGSVDRTSDDDMISFSATTTVGCPGTSIDFKVDNMPDNGIYLWNFGDGSFSNKPNPEHKFDKPGTYEVTLSITALDNGSIRSEPARDLIIIHEAPFSNFSWQLQAESNELPVIHFENTSQNGVKWHWDLGDGSTSNESHPEHIYKKKGTYQVTLTATNPNGCIDQMTKLVEVKNDYKLLAASTFSPNGDGTKDLFIPEALKILDINFKMSIFEPSTGRLIYETSDINSPWNGRVNNKGAACHKGEYVWVIDVIDGFNAEESYNGKVTLLR